MTTPARLTLAELAPMLREVVKDKSYRASQMGQLVGRYIRWFRNEWGATDATIRDYEAILARMSITLADRRPEEVDVEDLRAVIELWASREAKTRQKVTSVIRSFWGWAEEQEIVQVSPARKIRRPRAPKRVAPTLPGATDARLLAAAKEPRDRVALLLLLDYGIRRGGLQNVRVDDFDMSRRTVVVMEKGQKERELPLRGRILLEIELWFLSESPAIGRPPQRGDYLLYPIRRVGRRATASKGYPLKKPSATSMHRWWYSRLEDAGVVSEGTTGGMNMHRARHSFARDMRRVAGVDSASQALGHADLSTTLDLYGHQDKSDLERAFEAFARHRREQEEQA